MAASEGWSTVSIDDRSEPLQSEARAQPDVTSLVHHFAALLFRVAFSVVRSRTEAEDVVQDVFLRVVEHSHRLHEIQDMRIWLVRLTWNRAIDHRRRRRPDQIDDALADELIARTLPADDLLRERQQLTTVLQEIERLPAKERAVLLLSAIDDLNTAEIALVLGRSDSATRSLLFRARTRLRERLDKGGSW